MGFKLTKTPFIGSNKPNQEPVVRRTQETEHTKDEMVREFYELMDLYTGLPVEDKEKVSLAFQILWKMLIVEFERPENFGTSSKNRQMKFLSKIGDLHKQSALDGERHMEVATGLFGKSLAPVIAGDEELAKELGSEIEPINRLGWELEQMLASRD